VKRAGSSVTACTVALLVAGCSGEAEVDRRSAAERGRSLFTSVSASDAKSNRFACSTCHAAEESGVNGRVLPGYVLAGAVERPTFWGGARHDLLEAIEDCRYFFMGAQRRWTPEDEDAKAMFAYLAGLPKAQRGAMPFTVVPIAADLPAGDARRGAEIYEGTCKACHGAVHTGRERLKDSIPVLPEESVAAFLAYGFDRTQVRVVFIEKVRHGAFLGLFGQMPLWTKEAMSDDDLASLVSYLGLY
jgi:thiosulfate dehydrogenase